MNFNNAKKSASLLWIGVPVNAHRLILESELTATDV